MRATTNLHVFVLCTFFTLASSLGGRFVTRACGMPARGAGGMPEDVYGAQTRRGSKPTTPSILLSTVTCLCQHRGSAARTVEAVVRIRVRSVTHCLTPSAWPCCVWVVLRVQTCWSMPRGQCRAEKGSSSQSLNTFPPVSRAKVSPPPSAAALPMRRLLFQ